MFIQPDMDIRAGKFLPAKYNAINKREKYQFNFGRREFFKLTGRRGFSRERKIMNGNFEKKALCLMMPEALRQR
jgi:hypothetical protein